MPDTPTEPTPLQRIISLPMLVFYGLGTMVGGGIYALTGEVAGSAGMNAPLAFALAAFLVVFTSFSYAELSSRFPVSAGEVRYIHSAFETAWLSRLIGWLVVVMGVVTSATLVTATSGFILDILRVPGPVVVLAIVAAMGGVALWGIRQSVILVNLFTLVEVGGLALIVAATGDSLALLPDRAGEILQLPGGWADWPAWSGVFGGAFLAFFAFVGFEDMVKIAEEVTDAPVTLPLAILVCIVAVTVLYVLVSLVAVLTMDPLALAAESTPLAALAERSSWLSPATMVVISLLATVNGIMVQIVLVSRMLYGMAREGKAPGWLGQVSPRTHTPVPATWAALVMIAVLALYFPLGTLAKASSAVILFVFSAVNAALIRLKLLERAGRRQPPTGARQFPLWLPILGLAACGLLLFAETLRLLFDTVTG